MYRQLDADKVVNTAKKLKMRIEERFPDAGLAKVADEITQLARTGRATAKVIARPYWWLRILSAAVVAATIGLTWWTVHSLGFRDFRQTQDFVLFLDPAISAVVFIGAAIFFIVSLEDRLKRRRALRALDELRVLAHIVDMHQLTKDPERAYVKGRNTKSSPKRSMDAFELGRYFDYCCELLSLLSKIAAIYAQGYQDPVAVNAVDQVESMTTGLSRKIWQKTMILSGQALSPNTD